MMCFITFLPYFNSVELQSDRTDQFLQGIDKNLTSSTQMVVYTLVVITVRLPVLNAVILLSRSSVYYLRTGRTGMTPLRRNVVWRSQVRIRMTS